MSLSLSLSLPPALLRSSQSAELAVLVVRSPPPRRGCSLDARADAADAVQGGAVRRARPCLRARTRTLGRGSRLSFGTHGKRVDGTRHARQRVLDETNERTRERKGARWSFSRPHRSTKRDATMQWDRAFGRHVREVSRSARVDDDKAGGGWGKREGGRGASVGARGVVRGGAGRGVRRGVQTD